MLCSIYQYLPATVAEYMDYYYRSALSAWHNITPMEYGLLLVSIAFVGWLLMKSCR
jgi:hypothetical protein